VSVFLVALLVSALAAWPTVAVLARREVIDVPTGRSSHTAPVPRGGGLALLLGVAAGAAVSLLGDVRMSAWSRPLALVLALVLGTTALAALGFRDDLRAVPAGSRLAVQVLLGLVLTTAVAWASPVDHRVVFVLAGTLWLAGFVNAYNFMDGINGIATVSAALSAGWFALLAGDAHDGLVLVPAAALGGAALGFLPWNAPRARVFLGDVGSYGVGGLIALLALLTAVREDDVWLGLAPTAMFLADTSWTLVRRAFRHEPLMRAHRSHVYQRLIDCGLSHVQSTAVVSGCTVVVLAATWVLPTAVAVVVAVVVAAGYLMLPEALGRRSHEVAP
jgi:UDP-GlcNAc:undecaprenyl-phosphate GlcNAc-1-phosphate transferase